ncbi:MAG: hypothetical protein D6B28_06565 [Gammaproteobacteria bacterium]|nr:MAG: hypothetical protein D6B28_06565 [Gammaproteobacteria bacterium]
MDNLMLALTLLVVEVMLIIMLFSTLFLRRHIKNNNRISQQPYNEVPANNHKKIRKYTEKLYQHADKLQTKYQKLAKDIGITYPITEHNPQSPALIACIHCHHDFILSEISAVEMGEITIKKLEKHENKFSQIIGEFEEIEQKLLGELSASSNHSDEVQKLQRRISELKDHSSSDNSYLYELKKQSVYFKQENKKLLQQVELFQERIDELENDNINEQSQVGEISSEMNETLKLEKQELEQMLNDATERITDLEAYKVRFDELQSQVSSESTANKDFRRDLRGQVEGTESEDEIDKLINEYETVRLSLDDYLERPDVAPMTSISPAENDEKIQELNEVMNGFAENVCSGLRDETFHLAEINSADSDAVMKLKEQLKEVTIDRDRLEECLKDLENNISKKGDIIIKLENEISSRQISIKDLQERIHQLSTKSANITELELTIDRFSRQSMTMMQHIMDLEQENEELKQQLH